jgi:hypothetical protein
MINLINILLEDSRAHLYHAVKAAYAINALNKNILDAYTFQRYWSDGRRRKDDDPNYSKSFYYRGISLTRDIEYAIKWSDVVFVFDQDALRNKYKLIPYNWGYSIGRGYKQGSRSKREREEFLIVSKIEKHLTNQQLINVLKTPGGGIEPLDKYLIGFYISKDYYEIFGDSNDNIKILKANPNYLGIK